MEGGALLADWTLEGLTLDIRGTMGRRCLLAQARHLHLAKSVARITVRSSLSRAASSLRSVADAPPESAEVEEANARSRSQVRVLNGLSRINARINAKILGFEF